MSSENFYSPEMKALMESKNALKWLGVGLMIMWTCASLSVVDMVDSRSLLIQIFGYACLLAISATGLGLTLHMSSMESAVKALDKRLQCAEEELQRARQQSEAWQYHHDALKIEAVELKTQIADMEKVAKFWQKQVTPQEPLF